MHGNHVRVGVRDVDAGERESHAFDVVQALHVAPELLAQVDDVAGQVGRHVFVVGIVLLGNDERMSGTHGLDVQERHQALVFVNDVGRDLVAGDTAEQAVIGHACLGGDGERAMARRRRGAGRSRWRQYR